MENLKSQQKKSLQMNGGRTARWLCSGSKEARQDYWRSESDEVAQLALVKDHPRGIRRGAIGNEVEWRVIATRLKRFGTATATGLIRVATGSDWDGGGWTNQKPNKFCKKGVTNGNEKAQGTKDGTTNGGTGSDNFGPWLQVSYGRNNRNQLGINSTGKKNSNMGYGGKPGLGYRSGSEPPIFGAGNFGQNEDSGKGMDFSNLEEGCVL
ncbi:hypothetical protein LWI29_015659 [Acer saccharum]|uniref:Uncharacterized protein n=1 Tax=Acer saccharum TaxID=4024 RepID=A0AA39RCV6_ACESA|nr:hypothetical protein LWI29_015659 [Acer saccharum]